MCNRKSEISAFVEKKTGFDGSRTLIHDGFCAWCNAGSIWAQDMSKSYNVRNVTKVKSICSGALWALSAVGYRSYNLVRPDNAAESVNSSADSKPTPAGIPRAMRVSATGLFFKRSTM